MIAAVKGWPAAISALLFFLPNAATAAQDLNSAARELARRTAAYAVRGDTVSAAYRNLSTLTPAALGEVRRTFESALQDSGLRLSESAAAVEIRLTLSEDQSQFLLVEEARKGDDRQVWMASWKREATVARAAVQITLDRKRLWDQEEQILDVAFTDTTLLVLSPTKLALYARDDGQWVPRQSATIAPARPWPRDLRGHLRVSGNNFQAFLPGMVCNGTLDSVATAACRASEEPWLIESGSRGILLANYAAGRNYFDGRIVAQNGLRKSVAAFYSAAEVDDQGRTFWLLALLDGRAAIVDSAFEAVGSVPGWGSDIAGVDAQCGAGSQVMATRPTDSGEPDAVQLFAVGNRATAPLGSAVTFAGPVTALWSAGASVLAVERDLATGRYSAYVLTVVCGN